MSCLLHAYLLVFRLVVFFVEGDAVYPYDYGRNFLISVLMMYFSHFNLRKFNVS